MELRITELTVQLPHALATRLKPLGDWLPTVLELSMIGFKTPAVETATEIIEFLSSNPTPQAVMNYRVSKRAQERQQRLLALNSAGLLNEAEQRELDEMEKIEHIMVMAKADIAQQLSQRN